MAKRKAKAKGKGRATGCCLLEVLEMGVDGRLKKGGREEKVNEERGTGGNGSSGAP